jgi:hypothetical protein
VLSPQFLVVEDCSPDVIPEKYLHRAFPLALAGVRDLKRDSLELSIALPSASLGSQVDRRW